MSTFKVTIEKLVVLPHPNADALELAQVGLYRAVVRKGQFQTGDFALYIPEQAVLPPGLIEELGLTGRLAGAEKNRVKAVRLRGELSQGIVCSPRLAAPLAGFGSYLTAESLEAAVGVLDFSEALGITKWVPPVPVGMSGDVKGAPDLIRWIEIENIQRYPDAFVPGERVAATEKIHGTCCLLTYVRASGEILVSSKGFGGKSLALVESDTNLYWRAVRRFQVEALARKLSEALDAPRVAVFGEVYGRGVQDLAYGCEAGRDDTLGYAVFDVAYERPEGDVSFVFAAYLRVLLDGWDDDVLNAIPFVPELYNGPYDYELLAKLAEGREEVSGNSLHIREGLVVRSVPERNSEVLGGRAIAKFVSASYLTRGNADATEYE